MIHTPGHTPGRICLFLRESGVLVSGDALNITDGKLSKENSIAISNDCYDYYLSNPADTSESELLTQVVFPIK